jgi:putative transposase
MNKHLPSRWDSKGAWYFVTVVTYKRCPYFLSSKACGLLLDACRSVRRIRAFRLGALVILPDHWHALIKPASEEVIESIVGSVKQRVFHASRQYGEAVIHWQPRFMDHRIRSEADYYQHVEYIRLNPLRHEMVNDEAAPWQWPFEHPNPFG